MDQGGPPPPRPRIPNPNHTSAPSTQQPYSHSRDSFRPPSQHDKPWQSSQSSYHPHDQRHDQRDVLQPAPPPPPSPYSRPRSYHQDHPPAHSRRGSHTGDSLPNAQDPSPPGFMNGRHMPPPTASSPSRRSQLPAFGPRDPAPAPAPTSRHNNMSISSVLDSDDPPASRAPAWSPDTNRNGSHYGPHNPPASPGRPYAPHQGADERAPAHYAPAYASRPNDAPPHPGQGSPDRSRNSLASILGPTMPPSFAASPPAGSRPYSRQAAEPRTRDTRDPRDAPQFGPVYTSPYDTRGPPGWPAHDEGRRADERRPRSHERPPHEAPPQYAPHAQPHAPPEQYHPGVAYGPHHWRAHDSTELRDEDRPIMSREGPPLPDDMVYGPHLPAYYSQGRPFPDHAPFDRYSVDKQSPLSRKGPVLDASLRRTLEDSQMAHRSILGAHEAHRRMDRGSPLPQAVQGASAQPVGSGRDPGIKTEFTRVFSGLGSGVGSTPVPMPPNGSPTPHRRSDEPNSPYGDDREFGGARGSAKKKRPFDRDGRLDSDGESRKRRTPHHHHHHHGSNRPHHHHPKDDAHLLARRQTPLGQAREPSNGTSARPHHHHAPHHHHQPVDRAPSNPPPLIPVRYPAITIKTQPLLESVAHLPRKHLGSDVYAPTVKMPSSRTTPLFGKFAYATTPKALPLFEGKENCTFTVRVSRFYLLNKNRELVCYQRQIWGTEVYTDDSDVLAAAMHSGWVRGSWGDDVDTAMLDLAGPSSNSPGPLPNGSNDTGEPNVPAANGTSSDGPASSENNSATLTSPPAAGPAAPKPNHDLHITILILPALENYASSTRFGVRSRAWGANHDGMSFKIAKVEWVDEGAAGKAARESRTSKGEMRRARLAERRRDELRCRPVGRVLGSVELGNGAGALDAAGDIAPVATAAATATAA